MSADTYTIVKARPSDLASIPQIELAAARLLAGHAPESVLNETTSDGQLAAAQADGHLWIARHLHTPVGFAHIEIVEPGVAHLEELDVHPNHGRRGLGTRLVKAVIQWARESGYDAVTLCTFRDVPWNMPFYARFGFAEIPPGDLSAALRAIRDDETRRGLDPSRRVVMRRPLSM
jgi:GNAT superfamily N-acetyltransferase